MNLKCVTITGADDTVHPADLCKLSKTYPFVEWGILVSEKHKGESRFPSHEWIASLYETVAPAQMRGEACASLSLHVCGSWVRAALLGKWEVPEALLGGASRVQLNFHAERVPYNIEQMFVALDHLSTIGVVTIFQIDGVDGQTLYLAAREASLDAAPLYDLSHGAGVLPEVWPGPLGENFQGYAGGLGPDNVVEQLALIEKAAAGTPFWIDMETQVRSRWGFDLDKVARVLELTAPFVSKW